MKNGEGRKMWESLQSECYTSLFKEKSKEIEPCDLIKSYQVSKTFNDFLYYWLRPSNLMTFSYSNDRIESKPELVFKFPDEVLLESTIKLDNYRESGSEIDKKEAFSKIPNKVLKRIMDKFHLSVDEETTIEKILLKLKNENKIEEFFRGIEKSIIEPKIIAESSLALESLSAFRKGIIGDSICKPLEILPINKTELIKKEREKNQITYNECKEELKKKYFGKYVVIAKGKIQSVGESFEEVKDVALDANHRFIFKVEPKKEKGGLLGWPMEKI